MRVFTQAGPISEVRCHETAEKASIEEGASRWRRLAEDCLRTAAELEASLSPAAAPDFLRFRVNYW